MKIVISVTFPYDIKQTGPSTVEIIKEPLDGPLLAPGVLEVLCPGLSDNEYAELVDRVDYYIFSEGLRRSLQIK